MHRRRRRLPYETHFVALLLALVALVAACGSENRPFDENGGAGNGEDPNGFGKNGAKDVQSIEIEPKTAAITVESGKTATQAFKVIATYGDGTKNETSGSWSATNPQVGSVSGGLYTAAGQIGGAVTVKADVQGKKAEATLTVKLHLEENPGNIPPAVVANLKAATVPDPAIQWAYPYDGTVFPRGLAGPVLMWNNGGASDAYYVHITSATIDFESFANVPPPSRYTFVPTSWQKLVDSASGATSVKVARFANGGYGLIANHTWTIAPASMRGTIYYWANQLGRVMRIKPGATAPDDFSAGTFGALPSSSCTMTCHTVSADGSTIVSGGDTLGGSYNLLTNSVIYDTGGPASSAQKRIWSNPALSPNGKWLVQNGRTDVPGPPGAMDGLWNTQNGARAANSGLDGVKLGMPSFSPDGSKIAYVDVASGALGAYGFDMTNVKATTSQTLVQQGSGLPIVWPSVTPDAKWIVYQRGALDSRGGAGDLFLANADTPNQEIRLGKLDGDGYPFAAGARDLAQNYEPTFAPVASGGYFWVVFTSRRTYGNQMTGVPTATKQLWVAAIDLAPKAGADPSHPAFRLPGQDENLNMRGFWALDPCKGDGQGCASGTECCGGFCDGSGPAGALVCTSKGQCGQVGDHCNQTSDCCDAAKGVTCINKVCSEPGPK